MKTARPAPPRLDWQAIRARLEAAHGRQYWRSLEEVCPTPEVREMLAREFPPDAAAGPEPVDRRSFLKLMTASLAVAGLNGCTRPPLRDIVPYVEQPEAIVPGQPLFFATALPFSGFGAGMMVKSREGRPIKADGNPRHPASLGGSNIWIQACLLDLYDPDRAKEVTHFGQPSSWGLFLSALNDALQQQQQKQGAGLRFLTETVTSPTLGSQLQELLKKFPQAQWHQYEPINRDHVLEGARLAFGQYVSPQYDFAKASVICSIDSDFLYTHPERLRYARQFTDGRRVVIRGKQMNRLYAMESTPSVTGSMADNRLPLPDSEMDGAVRWLAHELGIEAGPPAQPPAEAHRKWISAMARDLKAHPGECLVTVGAYQPPPLHALEHRINDALGNVGRTVFYTTPAEVAPVNQVESLCRLVEDMRQGKVELLVILGGNPVFDAPVDVAFLDHLKRVKHAVHLSLNHNETSQFCEWHIPQTHFLESWSDLRAYDGTVTIQQPLIAPLFNGISPHELLGAMLHLQPLRRSYEFVRDYWRGQRRWEDFEKGWRQAVHDGVVAGTSLPPKPVSLQKVELPAPASPAPPSPTPALEIAFRPDPNLWDGRFANNPWLQELPKPFTKLTWDNAVLISPRLAEGEKLSPGDLVEVQFQGRSVQAPVWILPGQAERTVTLHLGYGRTRVGRVGVGRGFNFYRLRTANTLWHGAGGVLRKIPGHYKLVSTQLHQRVDSEERQIYREGTLDEFIRDPAFVKERTKRPARDETLYYPGQFEYPLKWGMAVDLTTCIGCNACVLACNIENNIPVVGKNQVSRGREMLWLRVDTYYHGDPDNPELRHQPVLCMHCTNAPCEYVCPVEATVHDHEGLNLQVYNRCIGTRYCSNNCPYKVRRFNFYHYTRDYSPLEALRQNPEVTVRYRGVMEKCTYCLQRIAAARIRAGEAKRPIRDGEVKTACQEACPTEAIIFGIMTDPNSRVAQYKSHPLEYPMLGQLNTRPRTTYTARLRHPNPALQTTSGAGAGKAATAA